MNELEPEKLDQELQTLFSQETIADNGFSKSTMALIEQEQKKTAFIHVAVWLAIAVFGASLMLYFDAAEVITQTMTAPIVELGASSFGWLLAPINNVGALLVALLKLMQLTRGRGRGLDRVSLLPF